jgi:protein gp37
MATTRISWTRNTPRRGMVWNPLRGCSHASRGCDHCYAEAMAARFPWGAKVTEAIPGTTRRRWNGHVELLPEKLGEPLRWKKPCQVFVNSVSDLFHPEVPDEYIAAVFGVMAATPQHTYQVLTKRALRMRQWFAWVQAMAERSRAMFTEDPLEWRRAHVLRAAGLRTGVHHEASAGDIEAQGWPLPNVWLGVTAEDQDNADERVPLLLATPAAHRFVSLEPLLEEVEIRNGRANRWSVPTRRAADGSAIEWTDPGRDYIPLDYVIVGGESGPHARPYHLDWARSVIGQCRDAEVPVFHKQLGSCASDERNGIAGAYLKLPKGVEVYQRLKDPNGRDTSEWAQDLRVQQPWPEVP